MTRYIAFLRALNLGNRRAVKMDSLRQAFESLGFLEVMTALASGNVVFEASAKSARTLERKIERSLRETLGYEVPTFIRTEAELAKIASYKPFRASDVEFAVEFNIIFLADALDAKSKQRVRALNADSDDKFHVHGREIYWLRRKMQSGAASSLQKIIGVPFTIRGYKTIKKIAAKYAAD